MWVFSSSSPLGVWQWVCAALSQYFKETVPFYWESRSSHLPLGVRDQNWRVRLTDTQSFHSTKMLLASLQKGSLFFPTQVHLSHLHKTLMATECLVELTWRQRDQVKGTCGSPYPRVSSLRRRATCSLGFGCELCETSGLWHITPCPMTDTLHPTWLIWTEGCWLGCLMKSFASTKKHVWIHHVAELKMTVASLKGFKST